MVSPQEQAHPPNAFIRHVRKIYNPLGFKKGYNFVLCKTRLLNYSRSVRNITQFADLTSGFIFGGGLTGFILARIQNLSLTGRFCPNEFPTDDSATGVASACYWISQFPRYKVAMGLHLATSLPAGLLAVLQFVPAIRYRWILYHRMAGYTAVFLAVVGNVGAMMLSDTAMGGMSSLVLQRFVISHLYCSHFSDKMVGDLITQTIVGAIAFGTTITFGLAIYNIRHLQLDQHRAWMIRTWFYIGFIVPLRLIQAMVAAIVTHWPSATRHALMTCPQLLYVYSGNATRLYAEFPICLPSNAGLLEAVDGLVPVKGELGNDRARNSAVLEVSFAAGGALALLLNAVGVEIYLWATKDETERLRGVSAEIQKQRNKRPSRFVKAGRENIVHTNVTEREDQEGKEMECV